MKLDKKDVQEKLSRYNEQGHRLFAFPAQSNVSGIKHSLDLIELAHQNGWDVLLDAAAFVSANTLDLRLFKPDFVAISFYKIFGYPTGLGCLLIRKNKFNKLIKPWFSGGTIALAANTYQAHLLAPNHERFEDGTLNYLDIPAVKIGLQYIEKIGMPLIHKRVKILTDWLIAKLSKLKHPNGVALLKIMGSTNTNERGGTMCLIFIPRKT